MEKKGEGKCEEKEPISKEHVGGKVVGEIFEEMKSEESNGWVNQCVEKCTGTAVKINPTPTAHTQTRGKNAPYLVSFLFRG